MMIIVTGWIYVYHPPQDDQDDNEDDYHSDNEDEQHDELDTDYDDYRDRLGLCLSSS